MIKNGFKLPDIFIDDILAFISRAFGIVERESSLPAWNTHFLKVEKEEDQRQAGNLKYHFWTLVEVPADVPTYSSTLGVDVINTYQRSVTILNKKLSLDVESQLTALLQRL